jgi:hypothetical protein
MKIDFICNNPTEFSELTQKNIQIVFSSISEITPTKLKQIINRIYSKCLFEFDEQCVSSCGTHTIHAIVQDFWLFYTLYPTFICEGVTMKIPLLPDNESRMLHELLSKYASPSILSKFTLSFNYSKVRDVDYTVEIIWLKKNTVYI